MLSLNDRKWKEFKIDDIFVTDKGVYLHRNKMVDGICPFISAKADNNGVNGFIGNPALFSANSITVEKVKFSAYYQPHDFYCSHDVTVLQSEYLNKYCALFICTMIMKQGDKYSYGRQAQLNVTKRQNIMLPITDDGKPDYEFMEQYIKEREEYQLDKYISHCKSKLSELGSIIEVAPLEAKTYKDFFISDIFDTPKRGKRIVARNHVDGNIPLVSSIAANNGVSNFIGNRQDVQLYRNCLSIANGGVSAGKCFYEPFEFVASDHVTHCKSKKLTSYQYFALSVFITKALFGNKYSFTREITDSRFTREKIILPINDNEEPDYAYMEQYVKNIMIKKYSQYLNYLMKKIS